MKNSLTASAQTVGGWLLRPAVGERQLPGLETSIEVRSEAEETRKKGAGVLARLSNPQASLPALAVPDWTH